MRACTTAGGRACVIAESMATSGSMATPFLLPVGHTPVHCSVAVMYVTSRDKLRAKPTVRAAVCSRNSCKLVPPKRERIREATGNGARPRNGEITTRTYKLQNLAEREHASRDFIRKTKSNSRMQARETICRDRS